MAVNTARDLIKKALKRINVISSGEEPSADVAEDALDIFNDMLAEWQLSNYLKLSDIEESKTLTIGDGLVTIGASGGDWTTVCPLTITGAFISDGATDYPEFSILTREQYNAITSKDVSGRPDRLFFDPGETQQAARLGTIKLYPIPDKAYVLNIVSDKPFTQFSTLDDSFTFPDQYRRALILNLAVDLAIEFQKTVVAELKAEAMEAKEQIRTANSLNQRASANLGLPGNIGNYNILSGGA